jgi:hypothetical protein
MLTALAELNTTQPFMFTEKWVCLVILWYGRSISSLSYRVRAGLNQPNSNGTMLTTIK